MDGIYWGIDLAKNVFQLCGLNQAGKPVYKKRTDRKTLLQAVANFPACLIDVEASTESFYWQCEELNVSQTQLAATLGVKQLAIAKIEKVENDPKLATLNRYVTASGGELALDVTLPDGKRIALTL